MIDATIPYRIKRIYASSTEREKEYLVKILQELADYGESPTYENIWLADYKEIPVDIDTFICDDYYLGKTNRNGDSVYPYWRKVFHDIFDAGNKYEECFFTGATRIGKSSTAVTCTAYMLYKLMCLRDPQQYFGKKDISKFSILFFNLTKDLAKGVAFTEFQTTILSSPWFLAHGTVAGSEKNPYYVPEGGKISIDFGSAAAHALGQQVYCCVMDEINFSQAGVKDVTKAKQRMKDLYNTISARVKGTFRMNGEVYGKIFAVSSKRSDSDFMEAYIQQQLDAGAGDHMYVSDAPQWEVLPSSMFSSGTFYIAVGDRHKKGFVVPDNQTFPEALQDLKSQGYKLLTPPIDMRPEFVADFDIALRDLAGISVPGALSFITQEALTQCINPDRKCPFYSDVLQIGTKDNYTIQEYFHIDEVPPEYKRMPMFIHLDLSLTTDNTGIGGVVINGRKDIPDENGKLTSFLTFGHVFSVGIQAPRGDKIPYSKIIAFIKWLRDKGFNIAGISRDQFQSEYVGQLLEEQGFDVKKLSLDRTPDGYIALRAVILEQRIDMLDHQLLQDELIHLQRDAITGRIDHIVGRCFTGDTKIRLVDGRSLTILQLLEEQQYRTNWVYTINEQTLKIEPKRIKKVFQTMLTKHLVKVTLDNGAVITCTPFHRFMLRDGSYEEAQNLIIGCSLMPLYTKYSDKGLQGYRMYYEPSNNTWHYEHRQFCSCEKLLKGHVIHHKNFNKLNNCPDNLEQITRSAHKTIHNNQTHDYSKTSSSLKRWFKSIKGTEIELTRNKSISKAVSEASRRKGTYRKDQQEARIKAIETIFNIDWNLLSSAEKLSFGVKYSRILDPSIRERTIRSIVANHKAGKFENAKKALSDRIWYTNGKDNIYIKYYDDPPRNFYRGRTISEDTKKKMISSKDNWTQEQWDEFRRKHSEDTSNRIWITDGVKNKYINKDSSIPEGFYRGRTINWKNHKVVSVEHIICPCRVYDLTIEDNPNFALDAGVFVHNSKDLSDGFAGAIWNAILTNPPIKVPASSVANAMRNVNQRNNNIKTLPSMFGNYRKF